MSALIRIVLSKTELQIEPNQKGELGVIIQNLSEIVDQYTLEIEGLDPGWVTLSPPQISLFPQDEGQVKVELHPPQGARAGTYDFAVKVISRENPVEWSRATGTLEVVPVFLFEVNLSPQRIAVTGQDAAFRVGLKNPGNVDLNLHLSATDPEEALSYRFDPPRVTVEAGATKIVPLTVSPGQASTEERRIHSFIVRVAPADAPEKARTASGQLECQPRVVDLELGLWPQRRSAQGVGTFQVQLNNRGNADLNVALQGTDPAEACAYKFEPSQVMLKAGESRQVPLTVAPYGKLPTEEPVLYDFTVQAVPQEAPHRAAQVTGQFECLPKMISFDLALAPPQASVRDSGSFLIQVTNRGDSDLSLDLSAADADSACTFTLASQQVELAPGENREVPLQVAPRTKPPRGQRMSCPFTVDAAPQDAPHLRESIEGELAVLRPRRRWIWALAGLLLMVVLGGAILALLSDGGGDGGDFIVEPTEAYQEEEMLAAEFWAEPDVVPRGGCTLLRWWAEQPDRVVIEGPGMGMEVPFEGEVGVGPGVHHWDVRRSGETLEGEVEVCPEEAAEYYFVVIRGRGEVVLPTFVRVEE